MPEVHHDSYRLRPAAPPDVPQIIELIRGLAEYEDLSDMCVVTGPQLQAHLFGARPVVEAWVAEGEPPHLLGFALFFTSFSTFLGKPGLYLEDLFVRPEARGRGIGRALMLKLAGLCVERDYGRFEWSVLDWNTPAIRFYQGLGAEMLPIWNVCRLTGQQLEQVATLAANT
jgi:GNAT superfamily N-acetyltransferase